MEGTCENPVQRRTHVLPGLSPYEEGKESAPSHPSPFRAQGTAAVCPSPSEGKATFDLSPWTAWDRCVVPLSPQEKGAVSP